MTFGQSYLTHMKCLEDVGMLRTDPIMVDGKEVVPLQVLKNCFRIRHHLNHGQ